MGFVTYTTKSNHSDMYNVFKILHIEWEKKKKKGIFVAYDGPWLIF